MQIVLAYNQLLLRMGLVSVLEEWECVGVVSVAIDADEIVALCWNTSPDVLLLDLELLSHPRPDALRGLQHKMPDVPVILLARYRDDEGLSETLAAGARDYYLTGRDPSELLHLLQNIPVV